MKVFEVCIIGAGQLGSRYLQGIANLSAMAVNISVVDPSEQSLDVARTRFAEVGGDKNSCIKSTRYLQSIDLLSDKLDLVIVSTCADIRRQIVEALLASKKVKYLVLEKVLFQCEQDFYDVAALLEKTKTKAWVNCPRRMFDCYQWLKSELIDITVGSFEVVGPNWGLCCNAIHFIDLFSYLIGGKVDLKCFEDFLEPEIIPSKREGLMELLGTLHGYFNNGAFRFALTSLKEVSRPCVLSINTDKGNYVIDETNKEVYFKSASTQWKMQHKIIDLPFQSQITEQLVEDLLTKGECALTSYGESTSIHLPMLAAFLRFLNEECGGNFTCCPIT